MGEQRRLVIETVPTLREGDFRRVRHGLARLETNGLKIGLRISPTVINALWCWHGRRRAQSIRRARVLYKHHGYAVWFACPVCGRPRRVLRLVEPLVGVFMCNDCLQDRGYKLVQARWRYSGRNRVPERPGTWLRWVVKRAGEVVGSGRRRETGAASGAAGRADEAGQGW